MEPLYLDHAATTPMRPEVREAMQPYLSEAFGNPSSLHRWGRRASAALGDARAQAAQALEAQPGEIFFTRGGTESDNIALLGRCRALRRAGRAPRLVVSAIEHHAIRDASEAAIAGGEADVVEVGVSPDGRLDDEALERGLSADACVASFMWVNNETGVMLPIADLAARVDRAGGTLHTDAVQAVGKVPVSVSQVAVHLLTVTGHKIYGPKGTGLLFVRQGTELAPLLFGGGQERALRPGTEDVAGAVGLATALELAVNEQATESERLRGLRDELERRVTAATGGVRVNGADAPRAPHVSSLGIEGVDGEALLMALDLEGIAASGGAACASGSGGGSHVISALYGASDERATVRLSLGRSTTEGDLERAAAVLAAVVARLRALESDA